MDQVINFFIEYGYAGMFISAFIAGSVFPFSSEAVILALLAAKRLDPYWLIFWATFGNVLGGLLNYYIGHLGNIEWIEKYMRIKREKLEKTQRFMQKKGAIMGFFSFLPISGSAITVVLGLMRANFFITIISMTLGKFLRFLLIGLGINFFI